MKYTLHEMEGKTVTEIHQLEELLREPGDFLDMMANAPSKWILLHKHNITEDFFDLKTRIAGEILQKAANYNVRFGIIGDFSGYESKSLKDFIYESNKGGQIVFAKDVEVGKILLK
jgi:hypothetical protein